MRVSCQILLITSRGLRASERAEELIWPPLKSDNFFKFIFRIFAVVWRVFCLQKTFAVSLRQKIEFSFDVFFANGAAAAV